jgi:arylsulfatase I/J
VHDDKAAAAGLPPPDSLDVWDLITGANSTSPRVEWPLTPMGEDPERCDTGGDAAYMAEGRFKLIVGTHVRQSGWCGQVHPNVSADWHSFSEKFTERCTRREKGQEKVGCLYDVLADPTEHHDLALEMPEKAKEIFAKMQEAEKHWFNPYRGQCDDDHPEACSNGPVACELAKRTGFFQPYLP